MTNVKVGKGIRAFTGAATIAALVATVGFTFKTGHIDNLCDGFVPENTMYIPEGLYTTGGISQDQFNAVMDRIEQLFSGDIERQGDHLKINRLWSDGTVNASAQKSGNTRILNMYGGLARHKAIGVEGMALVVCHELGHHNGGAPKVGSWWGDAWATNEGGADYYATGKCLRRYFLQDDNASIVASLNIDPTAKAACEANYSSVQDQLICKRISEAGQQVANLFMDLSGDSKPANYATPDKSVVSRTNDDHPATQCRLDTYFQSSLCHVGESEAPSDTDYRMGSCYTPRDTVGIRPTCWFAPSSR
ncbi:MAG TPA: hypothetical protein VN132_06855 [Bdellovibrio sp.]|nr:hypothetical protein [Bdellovibrio sp.]